MVDEDHTTWVAGWELLAYHLWRHDRLSHDQIAGYLDRTFGMKVSACAVEICVQSFAAREMAANEQRMTHQGN